MTSTEPAFSYTSSGAPRGWDWQLHHASRPRRAYDHISQTEVSPVVVQRLRPSDTPPGCQWRLAREIPAIVVDSLDSFWAFETVLNKLHGSGRTAEDAKGELVTRLGGHLKLLASLESPKMAPMLRLELEFLRAVLRPARDSGPAR